MAKKDDTTKLIAGAVGVYVLYRLALDGQLGASLQTTAIQVQTALHGLKSDANPGGAGSDTGSDAGAAATTTRRGDDGTPCGFRAGIDYVAPDGGNVFVTVIGSKEVFRGTQQQAEQIYNYYICNGPKPGFLTPQYTGASGSHPGMR